MPATPRPMRMQRCRLGGHTYFFTVVTADRNPILISGIERLRHAFRIVRGRHPFDLQAIVVLPDHLHTIWVMPHEDGDISLRWRVLKRLFSAGLPAAPATLSQMRKRERGVWQRGFWDHVIRDDQDLRRHLDYIHYNPVKHRYCRSPVDWPYSSFRRYVERGYYDESWGEMGPGAAEVEGLYRGMEGPGVV